MLIKGGYGLLEEMSIVELKERLELQKQFLAHFIESKKEENILKSSLKVDNLVEKAKLISFERDKLRNQREVEKKNKKLEVNFLLNKFIRKKIKLG